MLYCAVEHCLRWHCDNTSSLFLSPSRESSESPDCLGIPADKDPRCVMNTIMQLYIWKPLTDCNQNQPHWPYIWLTGEEFHLRHTEGSHIGDVEDLWFLFKNQLVRTSLPRSIEHTTDIECHVLYETLHAKRSFCISAATEAFMLACHRTALWGTSWFPDVTKPSKSQTYSTTPADLTLPLPWHQLASRWAPPSSTQSDSDSHQSLECPSHLPATLAARCSVMQLSSFLRAAVSTGTQALIELVRDPWQLHVLT